MKDEKYASTTKGIWIGVHIVSMILLGVSLCMGVMLLSVTSGNFNSMFKGKPYEESDALADTLPDALQDMQVTDYIKYKEIFETDGVYDGEKYLDAMYFADSSYQRNQGTKALEYKVSQLYNWSISSEFKGLEGYYQEEYGYSDFSEYGENESAAGIRFSETGELVLPGGQIFKEQYAPKGYESLRAYCDENQVSVEAAYQALYSSLAQIEESVNTYKNLQFELDSANTNLRFTVKKAGKAAVTNIPSGEICKKSREVVSSHDGYEITSYLNADYPVNDGYALKSAYYNSYTSYSGFILAGAILGLVGAVASLIYLTMAAGHIPGKEGITLSWLDKPKTELALIVWAFLAWVIIACLYGSAYTYGNNASYGLVLIGLSVAGGSALGLIGYLSLVRRIKARTLVKNSFCHQLKNGIMTIIKGTKVSNKLIILFAIYLLVMLLCIAMGGFGFFVAVVFNIFVGVLLTKDALSRQKMMDGLQRIAGGELDYKIDIKEINRLNIDMADAVNQVGGGLESAVEQSIKNERMKSDLITNVSHDIKTPLTSIINYVDLLKRENISDEKVKGYIDILDQKSQRLKQLTEDLVEASKISSGNVTLELNKMDFNEILQQAVGEFEERFKNRDLQIMVKHPETPVVIEADGRRIWRIIENLFQNVLKYAMPGTRVYVELTENGREMKFAVKNVSENPLNIRADELTERFIRGDVSRSTEGSGLGLSIAKSLTKLQKGQFEIYLDGDLFKVTVTFGLIE